MKKYNQINLGIAGMVPQSIILGVLLFQQIWLLGVEADVCQGNDRHSCCKDATSYRCYNNVNDTAGECVIDAANCSSLTIASQYSDCRTVPIPKSLDD